MSLRFDASWGLVANSSKCLPIMSSTLEQTIEELQTALDGNANEKQLLDLLDRNLDLLRSQYRTQKTAFSDATIDFLKSMARLQEALREFIDAIEEKEWVRTRDDAQELAGRLGDLRDRLSPHLVAKRADKEMREMIARSHSLPFAAAVAGETDFQKRRACLESTAKLCGKCGAKLTLRESQNGYFWGCSTFPACFFRRWLSSKEEKILFP